MSLAASLIALLLVVAISGGSGDPSIPSGDVAVVDDAPGRIGDVSKERFEHALGVMAAQRREATTPTPGDPQYDEVKEITLNTIFESIRTKALAAEWGLGPNGAEVARYARYVKGRSFGSEEAFRRFREELRLTPADVAEQFKLELIAARIRKRLGEEAPRPRGGTDGQTRTLGRQLEAEYVEDFNADLAALWSSRTFCAPGYTTDECANAETFAHPPTAPAGCYESPVSSDACPAPVVQLIPAMPGSVAPAQPRGEALAQRPYPAGKG